MVSNFKTPIWNLILKKNYVVRVLLVDKGTVKLFMKESVKKLIGSYNEHDVFNADKIALFYQLLPDSLWVAKKLGLWNKV